MSYLALARKYRPQTFNAVASQSFVTTTLQNAINMGRVSHAYLFTGPRGVGKTSTARIFAKALNCLSPEGINPCGKCENCLEIVNGTSLDVIEIDGASNRGVDEIRSLREAVKFVPIKSKYKIYIVDEVHMLTKEAFNALLKTLEEPPEFVIFIFATTDQHKLPPTIVSRCQRYEFSKIPYDEMIENIINILEAENIPYEEDALNLVIRSSDGCMRDALSVLDQVIAYTGGKVDYENTSYLTGVSDKYLADKVFSAVLKEEPDKIPAIVSEIDEKGVDYKYMTECLIEHTRNMLFLTVTGSLPSKGYTADEADFYSKLKKYASDRRLYGLFQIFQKLANDLKFFDFSRYIFEFALFKGASISSIIPVSSVPLQSSHNTGAAAVSHTGEVPLVQAEKQIIGKNATPIREMISANSNSETSSESGTGILSGTSLWEKALKIISEAGGGFANNIDYGYLVSGSADKIVVGFQQDRKFYYDYYSRPDNKRKIQKILDSLANPAPRFEVLLEESHDSKKKAPAETLIQAEGYKERQAKNAARGNPIVKAVLEQLDGEIESIDILEDINNKE
ncbi:MAG: DNA polymerase III subunit gamma/tau [Deferribacterales bacterium]|nr:DNA polymerase III subunit gamma/tau [Deferribacterales bacterium]